MESDSSEKRAIGLAGATGVGVGAIVGGGVLALSGVAFAATGPSAVLAFALNGVIALITALNFAELSSRFPQSGGTYTFAKRVLSVEAAFGVGWVVWFASIVAAVLYALGFGFFGNVLIADVCQALHRELPAGLTEARVTPLLALAATLFYTVGLIWRPAGGVYRAAVSLVIAHGAPADVVVQQAADHDLIMLGVRRERRGKKVFGSFALHVARATSCPLILISHRT